MIIELNPIKWRIFSRKVTPVPSVQPIEPQPNLPATQPLQTAEQELQPALSQVITEPEHDSLGTVSLIPPHILDQLLSEPTLAKAQETTMATAAVITAPKETLGEKIKADFSKATAFLTVVGKDFEKGLAFAVKEAPVLDPLATLLFPAAGPEIASGTAALNLIQNSVLAVEQKYAASGVKSGSGTQKAAEVIALAGGAVTQLLKTAGVSNPSTAYIQSLVDAVVAILNAQPAPAAA